MGATGIKYVLIITMMMVAGVKFCESKPFGLFNPYPQSDTDKMLEQTYDVLTGKR